MNNNTEIKEKEIFDETQAKQAILTKKLMLGLFGSIGLIFAIAGAVFLILENFKVIGMIFLTFGLFMIAFGIIMFFVIPTKYDYYKYKARVQKYGYLNIYEMSAKLAELEARIEELEKYRH